MTEAVGPDCWINLTRGAGCSLIVQNPQQKHRVPPALPQNCEALPVLLEAADQIRHLGLFVPDSLSGSGRGFDSALLHSGLERLRVDVAQRRKGWRRHGAQEVCRLWRHCREDSENIYPTVSLLVLKGAVQHIPSDTLGLKRPWFHKQVAQLCTCN